MKVNCLLGENKLFPFYSAVIILILVTLACGIVSPTAEPAQLSTPTPTPKVGGTIWGWECQPATLDILHGETGEIKLVDAQQLGKVTEYKIGTIDGSVSDADASEVNVSQSPNPNGDGWSTLPGTINITSNAVDGPPRIVPYYINIILGGSQGLDQITGGNIWCQVNVQHTVPSTTTSTPTATLTLSPVVIVTPHGFRIVYTGPMQVQANGMMEGTFQVTGPDNMPARGSLSATLGDPPSDPRASHSSGELDAEGRVSLVFLVNWPAGTTKLFVSYQGVVYEVADIGVNP